MAELGLGEGSLAPVLAKAPELTIAQESRGSGTLEIVILAEVTLVAAFTVAHTASTLALATA